MAGQNLSAAQQRARTRAIARSSEYCGGGAGGGSGLAEFALLIVALVIGAVVLGVIIWPHVAPIFHELQGWARWCSWASRW